MANKNRKNLITDERAEDTTMYGEFVPTFHKWVPLEQQRKIVDHMEEISEELSKNNNSDNKKK